ncbi:MAG: hypothetical protein K6C98_02565 [Treponema sp.]|nr:hypothetical protein [Treponema sp.]
MNTSYNKYYEDVITDIYVCENATNDNYKSVWTGKLLPGQTVQLEIDCGNYGVKYKGIRYYNSGIEKSIDVTTDYKAPVRFAQFWTFKIIYDGNGIEVIEED